MSSAERNFFRSRQHGSSCYGCYQLGAGQGRYRRLSRVSRCRVPWLQQAAVIDPLILFLAIIAAGAGAGAYGLTIRDLLRRGRLHRRTEELVRRGDLAQLPEGRVPCPECAEAVLPAARRCPYCPSPILPRALGHSYAP